MRAPQHSQSVVSLRSRGTTVRTGPTARPPGALPHTRPPSTPPGQAGDARGPARSFIRGPRQRRHGHPSRAKWMHRGQESLIGAGNHPLGQAICLPQCTVAYPVACPNAPLPTPMRARALPQCAVAYPNAALPALLPTPMPHCPPRMPGMGTRAYSARAHHRCCVCPSPMVRPAPAGAKPVEEKKRWRASSRASIHTRIAPPTRSATAASMRDPWPERQKRGSTTSS